MALIEIRDLAKSFGNVKAVDEISLDIDSGEFITLPGPSGSGKTTVLRMIAGFEDPYAGSIKLNGEDITHLPPFDCDVNTVFQDYALLAFALSFDEVVVTIFTAPLGVDTLPLWILKEVGRPNQASVVNVVATVVILLSLIPVYISQRLARAQEDER